jgi:phosphoglycolate phosphatase-like HAD superfamily hydrolase
MLVAVALAAGCSRSAPQAQADLEPAAQELASWSETVSKKALVEFVRRVTTAGSQDFVPVSHRIAVFDNDGTLWAEQPMYTQVAFALDRVRALAPHRPQWKAAQPFKAVLEGDMSSLEATGERGLLEIVAATHVNNTSEEFDSIVAEWIASATHPISRRLYTEMVFQPMLEVLGYLRANDFKTFIVSGGGVDFMRPWVERAYGIPPEQVIGSRATYEYRVRTGTPVLLRLPAVDLVDDRAGKPVGIQQVIGRRPIIAFGNSDGDFEMLEWVTSGPGPRAAFLIHHTDAVREWAYDRNSRVGMLARALDEADERGWVVVDMKDDWRAIFPFERKEPLR